MEGFDGEVGSACGAGRVEKREAKALLAGDGEAGHGYTVFKAGGGSSGLQWLQADGREENPIEMESLHGGVGHGHMAHVRRVETASEKGHARAAG